MKTRSLIVQPLADSDREAWDTLVSRHGAVFDSLRWTALFGSSLQRLGLYDAGGGLCGGFCVYEERKFGLGILRNPPFSRQIGPFYSPRASNPVARTNEQRLVVAAMADHFTSHNAAVVSLGLSLGVTDCLPFLWNGYKVIPHYTYCVDLTQDEASLFAGMSANRRNVIKKAKKDGIVLEEANGISAIRELVLTTFRRQNKTFPHEAMSRILLAYPPGDSSYCFVARHHGEPIAGVYVVHDSQVAYNIMTGYDDQRAHRGAGALAMYQSILKAKSLGLRTFDFEGSSHPPIERYFRNFGGVLTPVFGVHKAWLPLEMALKLLKRSLF